MKNIKEKYYNWIGFESICLEESWIIQIENYTNKIIFTIDAVLLENHLDYRNPKTNEKYSYKRMKLMFQDVSYMEWKNINLTPAIDANNEIDFGHVDTLYKENKFYFLNGDIGELKIGCNTVLLT